MWIDTDKSFILQHLSTILLSTKPKLYIQSIRKAHKQNKNLRVSSWQIECNTSANRTSVFEISDNSKTDVEKWNYAHSWVEDCWKMLRISHLIFNWQNLKTRNVWISTIFIYVYIIPRELKDTLYRRTPHIFSTLKDLQAHQILFAKAMGFI